MTEPTSACQPQAFLALCRQRVERMLREALAGYGTRAPRLEEAMEHSVLGNGKRLRPALCYGAALAVGSQWQAADAAAVAVELVHCYSLVHDDLPAMDDDDLRRGLPTTHRAFDEATAILAGDGLQAAAFRLLADDTVGVDAVVRLRMIARLAAAAEAMVAGQALDVAAAGRLAAKEELLDMHRLKTGALMTASVSLGALTCPRLGTAQRDGLERFGGHFGLAYQIQDDILDETGSTATLGKPQGSDSRACKPTWVSALGLKEARRQAAEHADAAQAAIADFDERADSLRILARYAVARRR